MSASAGTADTCLSKWFVSSDLSILPAVQGKLLESSSNFKD